MTRCTKGERRRSLRHTLQYVTCLIVVACFYYTAVVRHGDRSNDRSSVDGPRDGRSETRGTVIASTHGEDVVEVAKESDDSDVPTHDDYTIETRRGITPKVAKKKVPAAVSECGRSWKTNWTAIKNAGKPKVLLDPERFIYPVLINGPNNQLIGLRDTIYLAIRLNRTLIIPHFYKHKTDSSSEKGVLTYLPASQRVDVASIASLVSVVPFKDLQTTCSEGFDDLFFTSYDASHASLHRVAEDLGIPIHDKSSGEEVGRYPKDIDASFSSRDITSDKKSLLALYDSPGMCALYAFPFRTVGTKDNTQSLHKVLAEYFKDGVLNTQAINPDSLPDKTLYSLIVHSTPRPKHISAIVNSFLDSHQLLDVPYLSAHWRYDVADWQTRCRKQDRLLRKGKTFMIEMCRQIQTVEPADIAETIFDMVTKVDRQSSVQIRAVYFAAPLTMQEFVGEVKALLLERYEAEGLVEPFRVLTHIDLHAHLLQYSTCEGLKENYEDIFSLLEMDICSRSTVFLRSPTSSWSQVVSEARISESLGRYDDNIFDRTWEAASRRLGS